MPDAGRFGEELLNRGEDHATRVDRELAAQVGPTLGLRRRLSQQVLAVREGAEELVVKVVAVGQHDGGWVLHGGFADDRAGVESHREALARAPGVPDDADSAVAGLAARLAPRLVAALLVFADAPSGLHRLHGAQRLLDGDAHGVELVVAAHLLGRLAAAVVIEDDEVADQPEEARRRAGALQHHLQLGHVRVRRGLAVNRAPGLEPLLASRQRADPSVQTVRHHQHLVHREQRGQLRLIRL